MTDKKVEKENVTEQNSITPEDISENLFFTIPLYQRIFTWGEREIKQLFDDLCQAYKINSSSPYYLGMLTLKYNDENQSYDVIDGQQRLTILILLGSLLKEQTKEVNWGKFLFVKEEKTRLSFPSREHDSNFLNKVINNCKELLDNVQKKDSVQTTNFESDKQDATQCNPNLIFALNTIHSYLNEFFSERYNCNNSDELRKFSEFLFTRLTFFVTYLPKSYTPRMLNKYFDRMNDSGKNLEPHEILLGEYLKVLDVSKETKNKITDLWKKATDLSNTMSISDLSDITKLGNSANKQNVAQNGNIEKKQTLSILELAKKDSTNEPSDITEGYSQSLLNINELLLLCLYRVLYKDSNSKIKTNEEFNFNTCNIINTFKSKLSWTDNDNTEKIINFIQTFFLSRYLLDRYFLRRDESGRYLRPKAFVLQNEEESIKEEEEEEEKVETLMRLEEFLYVIESSESNYRWFNPLLDVFKGVEEDDPNNKNISEINKKLQEEIKNRDLEQLTKNDLSQLDINALRYDKVNRYWFWRLDLELWLDRKKQFETDNTDNNYLQVANNYHFRRNRSIEHVAPQTPKTSSNINLDKNKLDSFGNLCMISSGLNSSLKNESFDVKKAHVESYVKESVGGTIESLKLLAIYQYCENNGAEWNDCAVEKHGEEMLNLLNNSLSKRGSSL